MSEATRTETEQVSIEIDGQAICVDKGSMVIQAADRLGIAIPRFCYHPKLSIAANCRMCLVDVERAPKPLPACATPVSDGMKVFTRSRRSLDAQKAVMEFLLINHPLDCPICDQGGECELQDLAMGYGRSVSRFVEGKRVVKDEDLGSLVATDMTRCIQCTRCVRFLDEIAGSNELGGIGRGDRMEIKTFIGRSIDSELSGNVIDICPVGALTNKPFRFSARAWEMVARPFIGLHDSVGSHLYYHSQRGEIRRAVPRDNDSLNESWLSDRDRYSHFALNAADRLRQPQIKRDGQWVDCDWQTALQQAGKALAAHRGEALGVLASPNASMEELYLLQKLARGLDCQNIDHRLRHLDVSDQHGEGLHPGMATAIADLEQCDAVLLVGSNIRHDQPIIGHRLRKAWRQGCKLAAINPLDYSLHFDLLTKSIASPQAMLERLAGVAASLAAADGSKVDAAIAPWIEQAQPNDADRQIAKMLEQAGNAVVLLGNYAAQHPQASVLRALARLVGERAGAAVSRIADSANGNGAWAVGAVPHRLAGGHRVSNPGLSARAMIERPRSAYLLYNIDVDADHALAAQAAATLGDAQAVVAISAFADTTLRQIADVLLPLAPLPEAAGTLMNAEGRLAHLAGAARPQGQSRPGWKILRVLANFLELEGFDYLDIDQVWQAVAKQLDAAEPEPGRMEPPASAPQLAPAESGLMPITQVGIYDVDGLTRRSMPLQQTNHASADWVVVNPADASDNGWRQGQRCWLKQAERQCEASLRVDAMVPRGCLWLPGASLPARKLGPATTEIIID